MRDVQREYLSKNPDRDPEYFERRIRPQFENLRRQDRSLSTRQRAGARQDTVIGLRN